MENTLVQPEETPALENGKGVRHWVTALVGAAILVAMVGGGFFLGSLGSEAAAAVAVPVIQAPAVSNEAAAGETIPSFTEFAATLERSDGGNGANSTWVCSEALTDKGCGGLIFQCSEIRGVDDFQGLTDGLAAWFSVDEAARQRMVTECTGR